MSRIALSPHFFLDEFVPEGYGGVIPPAVQANLTRLARTLLEPVRVRLDLPVVIHSGWRPEEYNLAHGGEPTSDHPRGAAADFHVEAGDGVTWEQNTLAAFHILRLDLVGLCGQLIFEDHREHYKAKGDPDWAEKLWVHVSTPSIRHPGTIEDENALLISRAPKHYEVYVEGMA